jgi:hypothetical protein
LPVVVVLNTWTMPQERYNAEWVKENNAGIVLDSFRFVQSGVAEITGRLDEFRAKLAHIQNRAVYEIPQILERIMHADRPRDYRWARQGDARGAAHVN